MAAYTQTLHLAIQTLVIAVAVVEVQLAVLILKVMAAYAVLEFVCKVRRHKTGYENTNLL